LDADEANVRLDARNKKRVTVTTKTRVEKKKKNQLRFTRMLSENQKKKKKKKKKKKTTQTFSSIVRFFATPRMFKSFNKGKKKSLGQHLSGKGFNVSVPSSAPSSVVASSSSASSASTASNLAADGGAQWCTAEELQERVPALLSKFVSLLGSVEDGLDTRGLFRVVPEKVRDQLKTLRTALNASVESGAGVDSVDIGKLCSSVHAAAHAFKRYLQSLPEPLFSYALYDSFILTHSIVDPEEKLNELRRLLKQLPVGFKETAKTLLHFFYLVTRASAKNGVSFDRFANMFGATFLRPEDHVYYMQNDSAAIAAILKLMLDNNQSLFRMTVGLAAQRRRTIRRPASLALVGANALPAALVSTPSLGAGSGATSVAAAQADAAAAAAAAGVSRVVMRANTVDTLAPIAPAGSNAARSFYPASMSDDEVQRAMKAEQRRTASSLVKFSSSSSTAADSLEASPVRSDKSWQAAVVSAPSPVNTPAVATTAAAAAPAPAAADASADGSSGDDARSSGRVRRGSDAVQQRRRHRTGTRNSNTSDGTPSADASEEGSPRVRSARVAHRDSHRRTTSTSDEAAAAAAAAAPTAATVPTADDPLGVATASTSSGGAATSAHGDSVSVTVSHAGKALAITFLQRDTLESVLDALSKAAGATIADIKVVSTADGTQVGLLSQSTEAPFATHFGMLDEGLQFAYETVPRKKLRKKRTLTNTGAGAGGGEDEVQTRIASLLRGIKASIEQAALFSDAIALSTAVRDTLKLVNNAVKQTGADIDALREFKNAHPRAPLERVALPTADEQLALELNNLLDIVLPLMDQLLDLCAISPPSGAAEPDGVDADRPRRGAAQSGRDSRLAPKCVTEEIGVTRVVQSE
jgi:hypothetical protein